MLNLKAFLLLLIMAVFIFNIFNIMDGHGWGDDFSAYIGQAQAIANHNMPEYLKSAEMRVKLSEELVGPKLYPWGYPLILSIPIIFFGVNLIALKLTTFLFFIGSAAVFYFLIKEELQDEIAYLLVLTFSLSPFVFEFKQEILSDVPAMFFLLSSLLLIHKIYTRRTESKFSLPDFLLLGFTIFFSVFIRTGSYPILATLALVQVIQYKDIFHGGRNLLYHISPYLIFICFWSLSSACLPPSSYLDTHLGLSAETPHVIWANIDYYSNIFLDFFGDISMLTKNLFYFGSIPFFLFGIILGWKKYFHYVIFLCLTLGLYLSYPYKQGLRFIISLIPLYLFFVVIGIKVINSDKLFHLTWRKLTFFACSSLSIIFLFQNYSSFRNNNSIWGPYSEQPEKLFRYITENTKKTDLIAFFKPRAMYLQTKRTSVRINTPEFLRSSNVDYFVYVDHDPKPELKEYLDKNGKMVFRHHIFSLYKLK